MCTTSTVATNGSSSPCSRWVRGSNEGTTPPWCDRECPVSALARRMPRSAWQPDAARERLYGVADLALDAGGQTMKIEVLRPGAYVALSGRLGATTVADVRTVLADAVERGVGDLVVDLRGVVLVDATGLGVLVGTHRRADRAGRRLVL